MLRRENKMFIRTTAHTPQRGPPILHVDITIVVLWGMHRPLTDEITGNLRRANVLPTREKFVLLEPLSGYKNPAHSKQ